MRKVRLLYCITQLELGGAQKHLLSLISHLDRKLFDVFLLTGAQGPLVAEALSIEGLKLIRSKWLKRSVNPFFDFAALAEISAFVRKNRIDIVHTHSSKAGILGRFAARLGGCSFVVHTVHGWSFNDRQSSFARMVFILLERLAAAFTDKIIVVSRHDMSKGLRSGIARQENYELIRYGIDRPVFGQGVGNLRNEFAIPEKGFMVAMVACLKPQKCPGDFIMLALKCSKKFPDAKFIVAGDGVLRRALEGLIEKNGLGKNVIIAGWRRDIPEFLCAADVVVLTSLWEGLPISVLEAMASSKPVIATDTGGVEEVIAEGSTGFLVEPGDMEAMSEKLSLLLQDPGLRKSVGESAKNSLGDCFSIENMTSATQALYAGLASQRGHHYAD